MIKRLGSTGNGRLWMVLLQRHSLGKQVHARILLRAKSGTKHSILVDGKGITPSVSIDGAKKHYMKMTKCTLQNIEINRKNRKHEPTTKLKQHMCMDKCYDYLGVFELCK
jgi:hypothetical protein